MLRGRRRVEPWGAGLRRKGVSASVPFFDCQLAHRALHSFSLFLFIHSFFLHLLSAAGVPGTVAGLEDRGEHDPSSHRLF